MVWPACAGRDARCRGRAAAAIRAQGDGNARRAPALRGTRRRAGRRDAGRVRHVHRQGAQELGPDRQNCRPLARITMPNDIERLLAQPFGSLPELVALQAAHRPGHTALILDGQQGLDYAALGAGMDRVAVSLQRQGLGPGDVMAICAGTSVEYVLAFLGALRAGIAVAPLAPSATAEHLSATLDNSGAKLVLRDREVAAQWPVHGREHLQCVALDDAPEAGQPWSQWLAEDGVAPASIAPAPDWPFNVIYSSGTTGVPKGIVQSWAMRWAHLHRATANGYGPDAVSLCATPLYSNTTLVAALPPLALGGTLVLMRKFDAAR